MDLAEEMAALQAQLDNAKQANRAVLTRILERVDEAEALAKWRGNDYAFGFLLAAVRILAATHV